MAALGRQAKYRQISREIAAQIRDGRLQAGDRLASVKALCAQYRTGQRMVRKAIAELVAQGLVEVRRRSGCYVLASPAGGVPGPRRHDLRHYFQPRAGQEVLSIYLTELSSARLALWQEVLNESGVRVEVLSCRDGRLEDVLSRRTVDLVHTTPLMLQQLGGFVELDETPFVTSQYDRYLPLLQERLQNGPPVIGTPFDITLQYLLVNDDLAAAAGAAGLPRDFAAFAETVVSAQPQLTDQGANALVTSGCFDLLMLCGAVRIAGDRTVVDLGRARDCFELIARGKVPGAHTSTVVPSFERGQLLYLIHCSFTVGDLLRHAPCNWRAAALPTAPGVQVPAWLSVLGIHRNSPCPELCMDLLQHLCREDAQQRLAARHGNLPVYAAALSAVPTTDGRLTAETVHAALDRATLLWPEFQRHELESRLQCGRERGRLVNGEITVDEAVEQFQYYLQFISDPVEITCS